MSFHSYFIKNSYFINIRDSYFIKNHNNDIKIVSLCISMQNLFFSISIQTLNSSGGLPSGAPSRWAAVQCGPAYCINIKNEL